MINKSALSTIYDYTIDTAADDNEIILLKNELRSQIHKCNNINNKIIQKYAQKQYEINFNRDKILKSFPNPEFFPEDELPIGKILYYTPSGKCLNEDNKATYYLVIEKILLVDISIRNYSSYGFWMCVEILNPNEPLKVLRWIDSNKADFSDNERFEIAVEAKVPYKLRSWKP